MDYSLTQEQKMILDSVDRMLSSDYDFHGRCQRLSKSIRYQQSVWDQFSQLGLFALPMPSEYGGFGASIKDVCVLMEPMGKFLVTEPFAYCYLGTSYLLEYASSAQKSDYLPRIASGACRVVVALPPVCDLSFMPSHSGVKAKKLANGKWSLSGQLHMVYGADSATDVIVFAQFEKKTVPFIVPMKLCDQQSFALIDDTGVGHLTLKNVKLDDAHCLGFDHQALDRLTILAIALLSAEAVGIMQELNVKTKQYLQNREQFGQPLSQFQLLQHRLVEMYVQEELARTMSSTLAIAAEELSSSHELMPLAYTTKMKINDYAQYIGEQSVQLHGGMGVSDEMDIAHYFRRLTCIRHQLGDQRYCLSKLLDLQS